MLILLTAAFLTGTIVPVQTAANARLRLATGSLPAVVLISFADSFAALLFISLACGIAVLPTAAQAQAIPWWGWLGAPQKPVLPGQYAGLALMLAGVALIRL